MVSQCYGITSVSPGNGIEADLVFFSRGFNPGINAAPATLAGTAIGCVSGGGTPSITNKYFMP